ncbi:hypothetical protein C8J56DRAFT_959268 [Mycena floridula]|nr:hypothetical protein C8J56DRAFT_959268 [Mycena floridula]
MAAGFGLNPTEVPHSTCSEPFMSPADSVNPLHVSEPELAFTEPRLPRDPFIRTYNVPGYPSLQTAAMDLEQVQPSPSAYSPPAGMHGRAAGYGLSVTSSLEGALVEPTAAAAQPPVKQEEKEVEIAKNSFARISEVAAERGQNVNSLTEVKTLVNDLISSLKNLDANVEGAAGMVGTTRKRCASLMAEERPVKSFKSEPRDDQILSTPPTPPNYFHNPSLPNSPPYSAYTVTPVLSTPIMGFQPTPMFQNVVAPTFQRSSWSDDSLPTRHSHSLSTGSIVQSRASTAVVPGRQTRSGSVSSPFNNRFQFPFPSVPLVSPPGVSQVPPVVPLYPASVAWNDAQNSTEEILLRDEGEQEEADDDDYDDYNDHGDDDDQDDCHSSSSSSLSINYMNNSTSTSSDIPQEYCNRVDNIFLEYLNTVCNDTSITDPKGEAIHQTLMLKKMQRLDESKDFRPFKFRIAAFTAGFLEELARQGLPEEKIPMKKIRNYLWRNKYILRFNEDGKKAKSKGNHIWNIEAKRIGPQQWEFRAFEKKIAGSPSGTAYFGHLWSWTPRIWDPQASWDKVQVHYSSPNIPSWLSWKDNKLSGTPPKTAQSCDITAIAKYVLDGQEGQLEHTFHIDVTSATYNIPRLADEPLILPRSVLRDNINFVPRAADGHRHLPANENAAKVVTVLQSVADNMSNAAHSLHFYPESAVVFEKAYHVVDQSINALKSNHSDLGLARVAQGVVAEAAQTLVATSPVAQSDATAIRSASVGDLTQMTGEAIEQAVRIAPEANGFQTICTATDVLKHCANVQNQQSQILAAEFAEYQNNALATPHNQIISPTPVLSGTFMQYVQ